LEAKSNEESLWSDPEAMQKLMKEKTDLQRQIDPIRDFEASYEDLQTLMELGREEADQDVLTQCAKDFGLLVATLKKAELESLLSGEADASDCYIEIHAGAGGTEAQDWAQMLTRLYMRWAEKRKYKCTLIHETPGEEAGLKSVTLQVKGHNAYGWLRTECGVHRLVRISPFDSNDRRHTSFASVGVFPVVDEDFDIDIDPSDLRIDTYRASGAGGQHVNTTDSAVRITHTPTNIVVQCQSDRSQHRNRATAMGMLKSRLYEHELQKRRSIADAQHAAKSEIGWGQQIRSYVLQPYQMVKDLRTQAETSKTDNVLDGDIDLFLEASLAQNL
jgi:peptide chain release factor 2